MSEHYDPPQRPLIDFSGDSRETARSYAKVADSKVLKPASRKVLQAAARGEQVDAYALNEAVTDAMRSTATRCGQSMQRRALATKVAHLGHIVQAVIESHADDLPAYVTGERSRLVEELRREIAHSTEVNQSLTRDLTALRGERATLTQAASDERRRLVAEIESLKAYKAEAERAWEEAASRGKILNFALSHGDDILRAKVEGYREGLRDA